MRSFLRRASLAALRSPSEHDDEGVAACIREALPPPLVGERNPKPPAAAVEAEAAVAAAGLQGGLALIALGILDKESPSPPLPLLPPGASTAEAFLRVRFSPLADGNDDDALVTPAAASLCWSLSLLSLSTFRATRLRC